MTTIGSAAFIKEIAISMTYSKRGLPAKGCKTLGKADFMRLPWPAANITIFIAISIGLEIG
jgi:hypothetical protein